ncbi:hypothetical protein BT63DRAFT_174253 [Microthyrium microscopicum]|uniref:Uncharacterized protein n=1 Tax=Microthyrium microscopicum TaxID=703497 RepID=A0A6A6UHD3_9PEZI|nr:hypothetical protein BT63DRAFT_174253 [Microthyrium microscopicum]
MADVAKCFQFISENVPAWIATLESLEKKVKERQEQISRVPVPARQVKKTGSNESIRPKSPHTQSPDTRSPDANSPDTMLEVISAPQDRDVANPLDPQQLLLNSRKRKTASIISRDSTPSKYRTRSMIIVYYDSEIQSCFEQIVRYIGSARNGVRKARTAHRMEALTNGTTQDYRFVNSRTGPMDAFGAIDAALEKAQSLCERGAHQFLREGDCEAEIIGAKESFEEAKRLSDKELAQLAAKEQQPSDADEDEKQEVDGPLPSTMDFTLGPIEADDEPTSVEDLDSVLHYAKRSPRRKTALVAE